MQSEYYQRRENEMHSNHIERTQAEKSGTTYGSLMLDVMQERDTQQKTANGKMQMSEDEIKKEFKEADENGDGYINFNEMVAHEHGDVAKAKIHFADADTDRNELVDEKEWVQHHMESPLHRDSTGKMKM
jgi:hypothetical protein